MSFSYIQFGLVGPPSRSTDVLTPVRSFRDVSKTQLRTFITGPDALEAPSNEPFTESPVMMEDTEDQGGEGILDVGREALKFGKRALGAAVESVPLIQTGLKAAKAVGELATGELGTAVSNILSEKFNKNPNWRPGFAGEAHLVLPTKHGLTRANFCGPGTHLRARQARGDKGVSQIDEACKVHDMLYSIAKSSEDVRKADERLIKDIDEATDAGSAQKAVLKAGIRAKTLGEDIGLFGPETFTKIPGLSGGRYGRGRDLTNIVSRNNLLRLARRLRERRLGTSSDPTISGSIRVNPGASVGRGHGSFIGVRHPNKQLRPFDRMHRSSDPMAATDQSLRKAIDPTIRNATTGSADGFQTGTGPFKTADPTGGGVKDILLSPAKLLRKEAIKHVKKKMKRRKGKGVKKSELARLAAAIIVPEIAKNIKGRGMQVGSGVGKEVLKEAAKILMRDMGFRSRGKGHGNAGRGKTITGPALPGAGMSKKDIEKLARFSARQIIKDLSIRRR